MSVFFERIDAAPIINSGFPYEFNQWLAVLVDTLNELIARIQDALNLIAVPQHTSSEITALNPTLSNGVLLFDSTLQVYVGKESGALVKFTTTPYP